MKKTLVVSNLDFADSEYMSLQISEDDVLTVYIRAWNNKILKIVFSNVIQFSYKLGDAVTLGVYEIQGESSFLKEALSKYYVKVPLDHPFKLFQIQDIDDFPFIEVVAESVSVEKITP